MNRAQFWSLIDRTRDEAGGDPQAHIEVLTAELSRLTDEDAIEFDFIFSEYHARAYDWRLWAAAYIIGGGCSDDGFADFRGWLISKGEQTFEAVLADPDTLAEIVSEADSDCQVEGFQYIGFTAWEAITGEDADDFPGRAVSQPREPSGERWDEDDLDQLLPRLAARFS